MKIILIIAVLAVVVVILSRLGRRNGRGDVFGVRASDPEMTAAIAQARATLPEYWRLFERPEHGEVYLSLKAPITDGRVTEYFWVVNVEKKDGMILGTIDNEPEVVKKVKPGERIQIQEKDIADWGYVRDGKMYGKYTLRAVLDRMPSAQAAKYKQMLAEP